MDENETQVSLHDLHWLGSASFLVDYPWCLYYLFESAKKRGALIIFYLFIFILPPFFWQLNGYLQAIVDSVQWNVYIAPQGFSDYFSIIEFACWRRPRYFYCLYTLLIVLLFLLWFFYWYFWADAWNLLWSYRSCRHFTLRCGGSF